MSVLPESLKKRAEELISSPLWEGPHDSFGVEPIIIFDKGKAVNAEPASTILVKNLPGYRLFPLVDSCWRQLTLNVTLASQDSQPNSLALFVRRYVLLQLFSIRIIGHLP